MANIAKILKKKTDNAASGFGVEFQKKVLKHNDNTFRVVGDVYFIYEHWFFDKKGKAVHSICTKDENGDGGCRVCDQVTDAYKLLNDDDGDYTKEQIEHAEIVTGERMQEGRKNPSSWKAKEYAYMNVIDRDDNWCEKNRNTKILCKSDSQGGISSGKNGIFDEIIDVVDEYGDYEENTYDIRIKKSGKGIDTNYRGYKQDMVELTKEESKYTTYDIPKIITPTPDNVLKLWLEVGTKGEKYKVGTETPAKTVSKVQARDATKEVKPVAKVKAKPVEEVKVEEVVEEVETPKPIKKFVAKVKAKPVEEVKVEEVVEEVETAECPSCNKQISITSNSCSYCNEVFDGVEDDTPY